MNPENPNQPLATTSSEPSRQSLYPPYTGPPALPPTTGRSRRKLVLSIVAGLVLIAVIAGIYLWQHQKVTHLNQQVTSLTKQVHTLKDQVKQLQATRPTSSNPATPNVPIYSDIQSKARNTKRQTDIQSLQTQLEAFFSQNGYYPSLTDMNNASWRSANMKSLDPNALADPLSPNAMTLVSSPRAKAYAYVVTNSDDSSCEDDDTSCALYTLTATFEGKVNGASTYVKENLD